MGAPTCGAVVGGRAHQTRGDNMEQGKPRARRGLCLDVVAAYNRGNLPEVGRGRRDADALSAYAHPYILANLSMEDTGDLLMDLFMARRTGMQ
jgi:hypothetical protein